MDKLARFREKNYKKEDVTRPFAQVLNPRVSGTQFLPWGFCVPSRFREDIEFDHDQAISSDWSEHRYSFKGSGKEESVWVTEHPHILFLRRGGLQLKDRASGKDAGFLKGNPRYQEYIENREGFSVFSKNLVFFVSGDGNLLHKKPLQLRLGGAIAGGIGDELHKWDRQKRGYVSGFYWEIDNIFSQLDGEKPASVGEVVPDRGEENHAWWIFSPHLTCEERGSSGRSNNACVAVGHDAPTIETLTNFLFDEDSKDGQKYVRPAFDDSVGFGKHDGQADEEPDSDYDEDSGYPSPVQSVATSRPAPKPVAEQIAQTSLRADAVLEVMVIGTFSKPPIITKFGITWAEIATQNGNVLCRGEGEIGEALLKLGTADSIIVIKGGMSRHEKSGRDLIEVSAATLQPQPALAKTGAGKNMLATLAAALEIPESTARKIHKAAKFPGDIPDKCEAIYSLCLYWADIKAADLDRDTSQLFCEWIENEPMLVDRDPATIAQQWKQIISDAYIPF
jgi:hypothetical protein